MSNRLSFSEIIRESYRIFRTQILNIFLLALVVLLPIQILSGFEAQQIAGDEMLESVQAAIIESESETEILENTKIFAERMLPYVVMDAILMLLTSVFSLGLAKLVKDEGHNGALNPGYSGGGIVVLYENEDGEGKTGSVSEYIGFGLKAMLKFALTVIVFSFAVFFGFMILVIPGIILLFALPLTEPVTAYTGKTGFSAMKQCLAIMFGQPALVAYFLCAYLVNYLIAVVLSSVLALLPLGGIPLILVTACLNTLIMVAISPLQIAPLVAFLSRVKIEDKEKNPSN